MLIGVLMLANKEDRFFYATMYNDEIMILYILIGIYLVLCNKPIMASFVLTLALSVKAGVILLLPAFLGQLQYNFGTVKLVICLSIIVGF